MSTGVSDHQRSKGPGNSSKIYNKFPNNGPKDHHGGDHEDVDSWRSQQQHHQGYASSMGTSSDPYMNSYYNGGFQYQAFGVGEGGPWSTNAGEMPFLGGGGGGYSGGGMHDSGASGHYNVDGMFAGGNGGGGGGSYGNFGGQPGPGFGYGFHGNGGDYNTWGQPQPRKHYDDFYGDERGVKGVEQSMGGLGLGDKDHGGLKDLKDMMQQQPSGGGKKTTWASIASQPAKPQSLMKKKPGMPPPPIIPGTWENKNGSVAKAPISAPVQAPHPPAWERPKLPPSVPSLPPAPQGPIPGMQSGGSLERSSGGGGGRGYQQQQQHHHHHHQPQGPQHQGQMGGYNMASSHQQPPAPVQQHQQQQQHNNNNNHSLSAPLVAANNSQNNHSAPAPALQQPAQPAYPDELKIRNDYNPREFDLSGDGSRFFVIKSYSEDDIHRSIKYEIWCSTEHGNNRLDQAFREREGKGPIYLFFSVNGSGHFCGMAQMISAVDKDCSASVWSQDKWKGQFKVKWVYVKDVPNTALRHIKLENNENKPVTNSRDTQEVPFEKGKQVLKILHTYPHTTSIFDDFIHYEKRQEEEDQRRVHVPPAPMNHHPQDRGEMSMQHERGGGRGGRGGYHNDRGHHHGGGGPMNHHHQNRGGDRDFSGHRDNPRDLMRDPRDGRMDRENHHRGGGPDRDGYGGGRPFERDFHPRDRDGRPGGRGVPRGMPRN